MLPLLRNTQTDPVLIFYSAKTILWRNTGLRVYVSKTSANLRSCTYKNSFFAQIKV